MMIFLYMFRAQLRFLFLLTLFWAAAPAQELYSWHGAEVSIPINSSWDFTLHTRIRTRHEFRHVAQVRAGPQVSYRYQRYTFRGAYYFEPDNPSARDTANFAAWESGHRIFASAEASVQPSRSFAVIPRFMWERFIVKDRGQYNRFRMGGRVNVGRGTGPYLHHEWMLVASGLQLLRNGCGMRFALGNRWTVEGGWLLDSRPERWGGNRQAIVSAVRYAWGE
jgi:hypothetical protein